MSKPTPTDVPVADQRQPSEDIQYLTAQLKQSKFLLQAVMDQRNTAMNTSADYHAEILSLRAQLQEITNNS